MDSRSALPALLDIIFLTLGSMLAAMSQMDEVSALPVEITKIGKGSVITKRGDFEVVTLTISGLTLGKEPVDHDELLKRAAGRDVVLRVQKDMPYSKAIRLIAELSEVGASVSSEVETGSLQEDRTRGADS